MAGSPYGLSPSTIKSVYGFTTSTTAGQGTTIAIVDAYDDPSAKADLDVFNATYGLPPFPNCSSVSDASSCFLKVNQNGGTSTLPSVDGGWALEISLDVQWAHAIAPGARILLVEANSASFSDLLTAEDFAKAHAQYVSNSWGAREFLGESTYDGHFSQSGVSFFVSAGDSGTPAEYPSASPNVISVGGTTLHFDSNGVYTDETGWSGGGGGCSRQESATSDQKNFSEYGQVGCKGARATPDVALDADPTSGVSVYDSTPYNGTTGWYKVGGTSASSPMWAARSAIYGSLVDSHYIYATRDASTFRDITVGNNGAPCLVGYDLCSGRGSWVDGGTTTSNTAPIADNVTATTTAGTPVTITLTGHDAQTCELKFATSTPSGGTLGPVNDQTCTGTAGSFSDTATVTFSPSGGSTGGSFTYTVNDGSLTSSPATVSVTITTSGGSAPDSAFGVTAGCNGSSASCTFGASNTTYDPSAYSWSGVTSGSGSSATASFPSPGTYVVTLTVSVSGASSSTSHNVSCAWNGKGKRSGLGCTFVP